MPAGNLHVPLVLVGLLTRDCGGGVGTGLLRWRMGVFELRQAVWAGRSVAAKRIIIRVARNRPRAHRKAKR